MSGAEANRLTEDERRVRNWKRWAVPDGTAVGYRAGGTTRNLGTSGSISLEAGPIVGMRTVSLVFATGRADSTLRSYYGTVAIPFSRNGCSDSRGLKGTMAKT